jgi:hypothetical protein
MSTSYPGTIQSFVNPVGTNTLDDPDHAGLHSDVADTIEAIEAVIGTTAGTSVLKDFSAGEFAVRQEGGTVSPGTLTINDAILGSPTLTSGTINSAVINSPTLGSTPVLDATSAIPFYGDSMSRQAIINGNFDVWQRGTSGTPSGTYFLADRFFDYHTGGGGTLPTLTRSRQSLTTGDIDNAFFYSRLATNGAGSSLGTSALGEYETRLEGGTRYLCGNGKKVTLSFWAKSDIADKKIGIFLKQNYGTGGSPTNQEMINGTNWTLTSTWTKYTHTFTTNTLASKTFGTGNDDYLGLLFLYMWNTDWQAYVDDTGTEDYGGSGNIDIAQVQLCAGDVALPFMPKSYEEELRACMRYMEFIIGTGRAVTNSKGYFTVMYRVPKRTAAKTSNVVFLTGNNAVEINVSARAFTSCYETYSSVYGGSFSFDGATSLTSPNMMDLSQDKIYVNCEL